ncbi:hypothetical protein G6F46_005422 [Rhizopus delemar]|uniref:Stretch-activated cation channel Mid1 n=2 Tax=Rhizopus TaxID=4842 RepID=A0A9P7CPL0_9FUNG|nr:hypothetical protein G6F55_001914 [Rhizopus delemar]KAG1552226.1 hypothetical protein G6F51_001347 [Rhizopus arrhizus]KAG1497023.1 hypothetical protein G6F54_006054 [Rhizopus delemar]KAG1510775.1 hypothetical protein G6F53_006430 [Rhizopus delemar]KAG1526211.1 hypothetical protein G6F52_002632 [Rhizopus delemar]
MRIPIYFILSYICFISCQTIQLQNNQIILASLTSATAYQYYYFSIPAQTQLLAAKPNIYLTITSCTQTGLNAFLSTTNNITIPQNGTPLNNVNGLMVWSSNSTVNEIWIAVGTNQTENTGTYEIGVSTQQSMHLVYNDTNSTVPSMTLDDTDGDSALFLSNPLGGYLPNSTLIITSNQPAELSWSLCAAKIYNISGININQTMTTRGPTPDTTRNQFFISGLSEATSYRAYLLETSNGITGMTAPITFKTKAGSGCQLVHDLSFCSQVAYSVPSNPMLDRYSLATEYDNQAYTTFQPFATSLSQYNCESTQYSLVRNCTDCYRDYKAWLCAVTIPRCTDTSDLRQGSPLAAAPALRDVSVNGSRNAWIDNSVKPNEWTELLPCIDLCYHVVQSCPPYLQFYCPVGDLARDQYGYWQTGDIIINNTAHQFGVNNPTYY